jgi:hypothetical protein
MDFIYDFEKELVEEIIRHAIKQGYSILITEWIDEWEREEGCPSGQRTITPEKYYKNYEGKEYLLLPDYTKYGCSELNFTKDDEYICCYHIELSDEYICKECLELIELENLEIWVDEEILELISEDAIQYLHGSCHEWVKNNYKENDQIIMITELNEETGITKLIHCCLKRNEQYKDIRGLTPEFDDILEGFDYFDYDLIEFNNLNAFKNAINNLGIKFNE